MPSGGPDAEHALGAALGDRSRQRPHDERVDRAGAADQLWVRGHRPHDGVCARRLPLTRPAKTRAISTSESAKVGTPQPSTADSSSPRLTSLGDERPDTLLHRVVRQAVALRRPSPLPREEEEAGVLARAVVAQLGAVLGPALEIVGRGAGTLEERADGDELLGERLVRGARDRELVLGQAVGDER